MDLTKVTAKLTGLVDSNKSCESLFRVDAGAIDSMAPSDESERPVIMVDPANNTLKRLPAIPLK